METPKIGRKIEKAHPEWKEGDRMPIEPLPIEDIVAMDDKQCYERLEKSHNIARNDIFQRIHDGQKWTRSILLHAVLARLEGHSLPEVVYELLESNGLSAPAPTVDQDVASMASILKKVCGSNIYQKIRHNAVVYRSKKFALRDVPQRQIKRVLDALGIQQEELFNDERELLGKKGGALSPADLVRALELRVQRHSFDEIVSRLANEGNVDLARMEPQVAARLLMVQFNREFSGQTKAALHKLLNKQP